MCHCVRDPCIADTFIGCLTRDMACLVLEPLACTLHDIIHKGAEGNRSSATVTEQQHLDLAHVLTIGRDIASGLASLHAVFQAHGGDVMHHTCVTGSKILG